MSRNSMQWALVGILLLALALAVIVGARGLRPPAPAPTADVAPVRTQAVATFASGLTSTALAAPSATATQTPEPATETAILATTSSLSPTPSCYRLKYLRDVSIPDNTPMTPAEVFTKTWQVENSGTCAWKPGFQLVLIGGVAMGGSPFALEASVNPGARLDVSVKMVAPTNQTGIVQGTWRMQDETGAQFGDALTVIIVVGGGTPVPPRPAATSTP